MDRNGWVEKVVAVVVRCRWISLAAVAVLALLAAYQASKVVFDGSIEVWFLEDDPALVTYNEFRERFGRDEVIVVGLFAEDVFTPAFLRGLDEYTRAVESVPHVHRVLSLANFKVLEGSGRESRLVPLMATIPQGHEEVEDLREKALSSPLILGGLVGEDATAAAVIVTLSEEGGSIDNQAAVIAALRENADKLPDGVETRIAGTPAVNDAVFRYARRDMSWMGPIAALLVLLATLLLFRRLSATLFPLVVVGGAALAVFGLMGVWGMKITILGSPLVLVILVVGVASSIHLLAAYYRELAKGYDQAGAIRRSIASVLIPCCFTSVTTAVGFLSLMSSDLKPIREYGLLAALGALFAFVLTILCGPGLLRFVRPPGKAYLQRLEQQRTSSLLALLGRPSRRFSVVVLIVTAVLLLPAAWAIPRIEVTSNPMNYFRPGNPIREDTEAIDRRLAGTATIEMLVTAPDQGLMDWEKLKRLDELERWMEEIPALTRVMSVVDLLKEYERSRTGEAALPHPRRVGLMLRRIERSAPDEFKSLVQDDYSIGRITAVGRLTEADEIARNVPAIQGKLRKEFGADTDLHVEETGFVKLMSNMQAYLISSQIKSFGIAAVAITLMMMLLLRSWRLGLLAMIPNFIPIILGLAMMGVVGIRLDPGTVMIATVAIGLVVDDSCHFLVHLREHVRAGEDLQKAVQSTMNETGRPIILTSLILIAGFSSLAFGSFSPTVHFGLITAFVVLVALIADLLVLPATLIVIRPRL